MPKYCLYISGYGAEVCWEKLTKEQYDFWTENEELLSDHILNQKDNDVPDFANLTDHGAKTWDELYSINQEYYIALNCSHIFIEEVDYEGKRVKIIVDYEDTPDFIKNNSVAEEVEDSFENEEQFGLQVYSAEKGCFWDCEFETENPIDLTKFKFVLQESLNESDMMIREIYYGDQELENNGGDTRGKGIDLHLVEF